MGTYTGFETERLQRSERAPSRGERSEPAGADQARIYLYESNLPLLNYMARGLEATYQIGSYSDEAKLLRSIERDPPEALFVAWEDRARSLNMLSTVRSRWPNLPVFLLYCHAEPDDFALFTSLGVKGLLAKPFKTRNLLETIARCLPELNQREREGAQEIRLDQGQSFVRSNKRMIEIERQAKLVAPSNIPVLILGESGTGKEVLAFFTHKMSRRSERMFLKINCAAMPAELLESELFGYEQGAFTGALKTKEGKFETCDGGTIFLDEIGEMPALLQAKLLQVLQDGTFSRLGARTPMKTDVRVVAATNINMKQAIAAKTFREDLYYRLNGLTINLPPLRERLDEIPALSAYFVRKGAAKYGLEEIAISPFMLSALCRYQWPGNLRELENVINRFLVFRNEQTIIAELAQGNFAHLPGHEPAGKAEDPGGLKEVVRGTKEAAESSLIAEALEQTGWNRKAAALKLEISYKALLYKIKQYGLLPESA